MRARNSLRVFMAFTRVLVCSRDGRVNSELPAVPSSVHYHARPWGRMQTGPLGCILGFMSDADRFQRVIRSIDEANGEDPNSEVVDGVAQPKELVYGMRMQRWVEELDPRAPEALRIAARSQHIRRWEIPRSDYPMDRKGYLRWRTTLYAFHADRASEILRARGYDDETIERVRTLLQKRNLRTDPDVQTLEDAAALVFLVHHLDDFLKRDDIGEEKAIAIIRKTWKKMTERGHEAASALELSAESSALLKKALAG